MSKMNIYATAKNLTQDVINLIDEVDLINRKLNTQQGAILKAKEEIEEKARLAEEARLAGAKRIQEEMQKKKLEEELLEAKKAQEELLKKAKSEPISEPIKEEIKEKPTIKVKEKPKKDIDEVEKQREKKERRGYREELSKERTARRRPPRKTTRKKKSETKEQAPERKKAIVMGEFISVKDLSEKIGISAADIMKKLLELGILVNINQDLEYEMASLISSEFGIQLDQRTVKSYEELLTEEDKEDDLESLVERPPIVTVMGHVDHGKTSLLDAIRNAEVTKQEAGGITQHIGAYTVNLEGRPITFLDTPGHEAFTSMRARGAQATDIAILVVAANDGVMPQTIEAINHAKEAGVPIVVAINKIDIPGANPDRVKQELTEHDLLVEEWGGETIAVPVSALRNEGIDTLLEMLLLVAEMQELKANPDRKAKGIIVEAELDKGRGPVATVLVQKGSLNIGDFVVAGTACGRVRAMMDHNGKRIKKAGPSTAVQVLGMTEVPEAGDVLHSVEDERLARQVSEERKARERELQLSSSSKVSLDDLFSQIQEGEVKDLNLIIKADVQGSVEAVKQSLERLSNDEVRVKTIHGGVGAISESDVMLATASNAIIIGFNVRPSANATDLASKESIDIRLYRVIYSAIEDIEAAMKGMLDPEYKEVIIGHAEVRDTFRVPGAGIVAGCYVTNGKIVRNGDARIIRDGIVIYEGKIESLRRFKDDVREVASGYECGISLENFNDIKEEDIIEVSIQEEIKR